MKLVKTELGEALTIRKYGPGGFLIADQTFEEPVLLTPEAAQSWAFTGTIAEGSLDDFATLLKASSDVEIVLLGCGAKQIRPSKEVRDAFAKAEASLDFMDTGAACRTYNVLAAEGRSVLAALLPAK